MDVTVVTATFGGDSWIRLAHERARPSVPAGVPWIHEHADALHVARNGALDRVQTEWVVYLDADDELEPGYLDAMAAGTADLRAPAVRYMQDGRAFRAPYVPRVAGHRHQCTGECLPDGNWLVIGTCARAQLLRDVGGWEDFPWSEDWAMWARCWKAGASIEPVPAAVYLAHVRLDSRNRGQDRAAREAAHWQIHRAVWPELHQDEAAA